MLKEFYDFIAKRIHSYFIEVSAEGVLQKGESFCLKLDDTETVQAVSDALKELACKENNLGSYEYECMDGSTYKTFTLKQGMNIIFGIDQQNGSTVIWKPNNTDVLFHTNTGIIGTMGTGKTQFTKSLITQLYREQKNNIGDEPLGILIFDYKGDYNESKQDFMKATNATVLKPYQLPFNPLALTKSKVFRPLLPIHTANAFKDTISKVNGLGPKQQDSLFQCIIEAYRRCGIIASDPDTWNNEAPTFEQVYQIYSNDDEIKKNDSLASIMNKLHQFQVFESVPSRTKSLFDILKGVVVIDLSGYDADIQSLVVAITLDLFYTQMQAVGSSKLEDKYRQLTKLILIDEADNFMAEGFPSLKKILKEGREFGVGTILSTQFLKHLTNKEAYELIVEQNLYDFPAKNPSHVVNGIIRRYCYGLNFPTASPIKYFKIVGYKGKKPLYSVIEIKEDIPIISPKAILSDEILPEEKIQKFYNEHLESIYVQLIENIMAKTPDFFERLIVDLLLKMGYGYDSDSGVVVGGSHDNGIDGIISEDKLGLSLIYLQAKRYNSKNAVGSKEIQSFVGAMQKIQKP